MIAGRSAGPPIALETTVRVSGARGLEPCSSDPDAYRSVVRSTFRSEDLPAFTRRLNAIRILLQDSLGFTVHETLLSGNVVVFMTSCSERWWLVERQEREVRARRISFLVEIPVRETFPSDATYTVRALIQYRRRAESTWRREDSEALYRRSAEEVRGGIDALSASPR
jgi:hypothetical protein